MEKPRRSDEELLTLLRGGDQEAEWELYDRYKLLVRARARTFFLVGADHEDLVQEGMLGLYKAVCEFDSRKNASFRSFAELCITRQILTAIKTATRKKHQPLNTYVSLNQPVFEPGSTDRTLLDILSGMGVSDPEEMLIGRENMEAVARDIQKKLSPLEKQVLGLYIEGLSYQQIGQLLHKPPKSIDNAIQRVKKKLEELSGGTENQIVAKVSGTVQTVECTAGETKAKDAVLCTIEVPDMGYTMSFSVTNEQARRLKVGDSATVTNYYWGSQIVATLESIRVDPKNPQTNKLLTFTLSGDVTAGSELTISVGQKSANYDLIVPNSAIRSDANGKFVLKIEAKSSPLGNRYIARRVNVDVLAEDDVNSAVTGDLSEWGEFVIATSNAPVKNGDMVRLADNG